MDTPTTKQPAFNLRIDLRVLCLILLGVIVIMLLMWQPWVNTDPTRSIESSGSATIKAEPDEYVFSPTYQKSGADQKTAQDAVNTEATTIVEELKRMGVSDENIKLNAYSYKDYYPMSIVLYEDGGQFTATVNLEVIVNNGELAQKIQDYLVGTSATGQVSPYARFSQAKLDELETQARAQAIDDAKAEAKQSAKLLGVRVGKALEVSESSPFEAYPLSYGSAIEDVEGRAASLPVQVGQNEFTYTVSVRFAIR